MSMGDPIESSRRQRAFLSANEELFPGPPPKDETLTLRLPADLHQALRSRADAEDRTISSVLRVAAMRYLDTPCPVPALTAPQAEEGTDRV